MIDTETLAAVWAAIGASPPPLTPITEAELTPDQAEILTARDGFTRALARRAGRPMNLRVLGRIPHGDGGLARLSILGPEEGSAAALVGLVIDDAGSLAPSLLARIAAEREPFGVALDAAGVAFRSTVGGFFRLDAAPSPIRGLSVGRTAWVQGADGRTLARVVEIIPAS